MKNKRIITIVVAFCLIIAGGLTIYMLNDKSDKNDDVSDKTNDDVKEDEVEEEIEEKRDFGDISNEEKYLIIANETIESDVVGKLSGSSIYYPSHNEGGNDEPYEYSGNLANNTLTEAANWYRDYINAFDDRGYNWNTNKTLVEYRKNVNKLEDFTSLTVAFRIESPIFITSIISEDKCKFDDSNFTLSCYDYKLNTKKSDSGADNNYSVVGVKYDIVYTFDENDKLLNIDLKQVLVESQTDVFKATESGEYESVDSLKSNVAKYINVDSDEVVKLSKTEFMNGKDARFYTEYLFLEEKVDYDN